MTAGAGVSIDERLNRVVIRRRWPYRILNDRQRLHQARNASLLLKPQQSLPIGNRFRIGLATVLLSVVAGCGPSTTEVSSPIPLPEAGAAHPCMGIDGPFQIVGTPDIADSPVSTVVRQRLVPIRWPSGFSATFTPAVVIWSADGRAIAKAGDDIPSGIWGPFFVCGSTKGIDVFYGS
jgi:hypothetical protein